MTSFICIYKRRSEQYGSRKTQFKEEGFEPPTFPPQTERSGQTELYPDVINLVPCGDSILSFPPRAGGALT